MKEPSPSPHSPPLHPWPLDRLLRRVAAEWEAHKEIFSLAGRRFFKPDARIDLAWSDGNRTMSTPVGPAAGPHTQLAQNFVLGWLAGARSFELKTVQILDELEIPRPCIEMENVGYNVEWSQELTLEQSLHEYVKSWLLLAVLRQWAPLRDFLGDPGQHAFELSVGYDLAGLQTERMTKFIHDLRHAGPMIDALRSEICEPFTELRDVPVDGELVSHATLSTFHGCPPDEIEGIVKHLMTTHDLDVSVKLNPTLLGPDLVAEILHDRLGWADVELVPEAFAQDLEFERAVSLVSSLRDFAAERGRRFGIKLTNTLVVANHRGIMPGENMYLSGRPLHVLAVTLLDRLVEALPGTFNLGSRGGPVQVAFSAGVDKNNMAEMVALGLRPVTICTDLLLPGGYGRMAQGLRGLAKQMKIDGIEDLAGLGARAEAQALAAGHRDAVAAAAARLTTPAGCLRYSQAGSGKPLRVVDHDLEMFDCVACTNCVTVCPNNAFLSVATGELEGLEARAQYLVLAELCNDCGNCTTFCPEEGQPQVIKPRLYLDAAAWQDNGREGFLITADPTGGLAIAGDSAAAGRLQSLLAESLLPRVVRQEPEE